MRLRAHDLERAAPGFAGNGLKDRQQALVLAHALARDEPDAVVKAYDDAPAAMRTKLRGLRNGLAKELAQAAAPGTLLEQCLAQPRS